MNAVLVWALTAGAVGLLALIAFRLLGHALGRGRAFYSSHRGLSLADALLFLDRRQRRALSACCAGLGALAGTALLSAPLAAAASLACGLAPAWAARRVRRRRLLKLEQQLAPALEALSSALKAGLSLAQALHQVAQDCEDPLGRELGHCVRQTRLGLGLDDALRALARRVDSEHLSLAVVACNVARQVGADLSEILATVAEAVRERFRLQGRIDALTSQGRLQGWILAGLPVVVGLTLDAMRPDLMRPMFAHAFGYALVGAVGVMEVAGLLLIRRLVAIDV